MILLLLSSAPSLRAAGEAIHPQALCRLLDCFGLLRSPRNDEEETDTSLIESSPPEREHAERVVLPANICIASIPRLNPCGSTFAGELAVIKCASLRARPY